ncbi:hypothetical protein GCM10028812_35180 [Ancylobacter sonchi]
MARASAAPSSSIVAAKNLAVLPILAVTPALHGCAAVGEWRIAASLPSPKRYHATRRGRQRAARPSRQGETPQGRRMGGRLKQAFVGPAAYQPESAARHLAIVSSDTGGVSRSGTTAMAPGKLW